MKQTLDKKIRSSMRILPAGSKMKQEYASGRKWGGDAPIKTVSGEINIFDPGKLMQEHFFMKNSSYFKSNYEHLCLSYSSR